jgi:hypothetical protein
MPQPLAAAADIETKIAKILGHQAVKVKPYEPVPKPILTMINAKRLANPRCLNLQEFHKT